MYKRQAYNEVANGYINYTINGGRTWVRLATPHNHGLNSIQAVNPTTAWATGVSAAGTGTIMYVHEAP